VRWVFIGSNGIRAGWRLLIYATIFVVLAAVLQIAAMRLLHVHRAHGSLAPWFPLLANVLLLVPMMIAALVMSRIERRPMGAYGLPLQGVFARNAGIGALLGLVSLSIVLAIIFAGGGVHFAAPTFAPSIAIDGLVFLVGSIFVGLTEEFLFRGYAQYTLAQGIGFWPAALVLSLGFATAHISNRGETVMGIVQIAIYGLVFCFSLQQTGNLWLAVGYHAAWDWGETFFYGVPDSGYVGTSSFLHGTMLGPAWLSGGADGPEGSILTTIALLALIPLIRLFSHGSARLVVENVHHGSL
jgi:uncharacterized protein